MTKEKLLSLGVKEDVIVTILEEFEKLENENKALEEGKKLEIDNIKIEYAIDLAITKANGKNKKAIRALLDFDNILVNEEGTVFGVDNQIENLVNSEDSSFLFGKDEFSIRGIRPDFGDKKSNVLTKEDFRNMSYKEKNDLYNSNIELYRQLAN